ncbi:ABC transporter permease [Entomobacter blattae]|uniref:ABC-2 type transporter n=1 Tax=Entomobacter blattae TaxID=2762277 RepID=A0A7H1NT70_9PROT|nr:ABC transporter permease [Entomobacter blattae]QNT78980.1 ABC-2 type transporter [Entomobacter blattae]
MTPDSQPRQHETILVLKPEKGAKRFGSALRDITDGLKFWRLFCKLSWLDIKLRYRGSLLGPLWITLSTTVMIASMAGIYAYLFHMSLKDYLPFLTISIVLWGYVHSTISDGTTAFTTAQNIIHSLRIPFSIHVFRTLIRNVYLVLHNIIVVVAVFAIYRILPNPLMTLPALVLWSVDAFFLCLLLSTLGARYRDVSPIIASILQILFFITPIIWKPDLIYLGRQYMLLNPFFPLIEIMRAPLMGEIPRLSIWVFAVGYSVLIWLAGFLVFTKARARLAYWI